MVPLKRTHATRFEVWARLVGRLFAELSAPCDEELLSLAARDAVERELALGSATQFKEQLAAVVSERVDGVDEAQAGIVVKMRGIGYGLEHHLDVAIEVRLGDKRDKFLLGGWRIGVCGEDESGFRSVGELEGAEALVHERRRFGRRSCGLRGPVDCGRGGLRFGCRRRGRIEPERVAGDVFERGFQFGFEGGIGPSIGEGMLGTVARIGDGHRLFKINRQPDEARQDLETVHVGEAALEARAVGILIPFNRRDRPDIGRRSFLGLVEDRPVGIGGG